VIHRRRGVGVAVDAAVAAYEHAYALIRAHGEAGWTARFVPLTADGLIYASSMVMLDSARRKMPVPALARWLLGVGITATLAANLAHCQGHGLASAAVAAWPAVALVGSCELLMVIIRGAQVRADVTAVAGLSGRLPRTVAPRPSLRAAARIPGSRRRHRGSDSVVPAYPGSDCHKARAASPLRCDRIPTV
jgi:Protein of unknown function (DUF2637)